MRIPSQFTEDNLYRRENRPRNRSKGQGDVRRIIHLLIALGLILVIMHQASKPAIYETFFGAVRPQTVVGGVSPASKADSTDQIAQIDPTITATVVDGTVWRSGDFGALYWCLDDARNLSATNGPVVGVVPLLQQPDVFLNGVVRSRGRVVRSERIEATENNYGITEYWQLWIRPSGGADRPLVMIAQTVPDEISAVRSDAIDANGPNVFVVGRFLKRLAYRSSVGADLAPVVVGKLIVMQADTNDSRDRADGTVSANQPRLWLLIGLSTIIGLSLAALAMWRTAVTANRTREIRSSRSKKPDSFLQILGASQSDSANHNPNG